MLRLRDNVLKTIILQIGSSKISPLMLTALSGYRTAVYTRQGLCAEWTH